MRINFEATAYHEAGHAVAAVLEGFTLYKVQVGGPSIPVDADGLTVSGSLAKTLNSEADGVARRDRVRIEKSVRIYLAGALAQRLHARRSCRTHHASSDFGRVIDLLSLVTRSTEELQAYRK